MKLNFFKILFILLLIIIPTLHCNFSEQNKTKITIRFWNGFTGPDGRTMLRLVKKFNTQNPDINVLMQRVEWATYYNKLFVAGIGNRAPEVFVVHTDVMERFINANFIQPIDNLIHSKESIDTSDIDSNVWSAIARNHVHFGLPLDIHPLGMYYNKKLFRESGIVNQQGEPVPPQNKEQFLEAATKLTKDTDGNGHVDQWGFVFTWQRTNLYTLMKQFGGQFFSENYSQSIMNNEKNIAALQFAVDLIQKNKVAPSPQNIDAWIGFRQGKVGMVFEGIYMLADLKRQSNLDYGSAVLPQIGSQQATWCNSHNLCIRNNLDEKKQDASWKFIRFLSDNSLDWAEGGQIPVRKSLRQTDRFFNMTAQREFAKQIPYLQYAPLVPFIFEFLAEFDITIEKALMGNVNPEETLTVSNKKIQNVIFRYHDMLKGREQLNE